MTMTEFINTGSGLHDCCLIYKLTNLVNQKVYIRIHELTGKCSRLQFDINQKFTRIKGTKKAGYIWMLYDSYKNQI